MLLTDAPAEQVTLVRVETRLRTRFHKFAYERYDPSSKRGMCGEVEGSVPRPSPFAIVLTPKERAELARLARKRTLPYREVVRAKGVLLAAAGLSNEEIARRLSTTREVVSKWRKRFFEERLAGLEERDRPGRPRIFSP